MDFVLVAGLWLKHTVWDDVAAELTRLGHDPTVVRLPGVDDGTSDATLADQTAAVIAAVDAADRPVVVGHSAACTLAWLAADRRPDSVAAIVLIGGFPAAHGETYADFFPVVDGIVPFPGWEPFEGPDADDLDADTRSRMAADTVPVPGRVAQGVVELADDRRFDIPVTLVCPEFGPDQARAWIDGGDVPELARATRLDLVDIDSGHWPMVTRPVELAGLLAEVTTSR